jgi:hypothetical protein
MPLNFNAGNLPPMVSEYVAWVDVMGTQVSMSRSIKTTANFIFKLHIAALTAKTAAVRIYPVMDGFYASAADRHQMLSFLRNVFRAVAEEFSATIESQHRFLIRGGLAYGPVIHGQDVGQCAQELQNNAGYAGAVLLGMPMVQAHLSERDAPPFGVFVHESARVFAPAGGEPLHWIWWKWKIDNNEESLALWNNLKGHLLQHFEWCKARAQAILYASDRIEAHKKMVEQYFEE